MYSSRTQKIVETAKRMKGDEHNNEGKNEQPSCSFILKLSPRVFPGRKIVEASNDGGAEQDNGIREYSDFSEDNDDSDMDKNYDTGDVDAVSSDEEDVDVFRTVSRRNLVKRSRMDVPVTTALEPNEGKIGRNTRNGVYSRKKRAERKTRRNTGKSYINAKGKEVKERKSIPLPMCRMKCRDKVEIRTDEQKTIREQIFDEYWSLGDRNKRVNFIVGLVDTQEPATSRKRTTDPEKEKFRMKTHSFHLRVSGNRIRVCRGCFMKTLNETQMFITLALLNKNSSISGITSDDRRGRSEPRNKHSSETIQKVRDHILSFPLYQSHYTRRESSRRFLPPHLNLRIMYDLYSEQTTSEQKLVSRQVYEREFHKQNLSFKEPNVDTCHKCDLLETKRKIASDEEKVSIELELAEHHAQADNTYLAKKNGKQLAFDDDTLLCYTFDLQQCLPTPMLNTSVAFYKRQLWTFNLTMHETSTGVVRCYMWHEAEGARGGNQIATCIYKELIALPPQVSKVILYSDTCGGQNKNSHVAAMFMVAMQSNKNLLIVDHKFMVSGHSHLECDVDHGLIEKQKKKLQVPISHPHDWYQLVRSVGKKKKFQVVELSHVDFLNFSDLLKTDLLLRKKDTDGNPFNWHEAKWFRYTREVGLLFFKTSIAENEPFKCLNLIRRGKSGEDMHPSILYKSSLPISKEKKKDILDLLPLIPPTFHDFYKNLKTTEMADAYPDTEDSEDNE